MLTFSEFLLENPIDLGDIYNLPSFGKVSQNHVKYIVESKPTILKYENYWYSISTEKPYYFALYENDSPKSIMFYIHFDKHGKVMHIKMMDKTNNTKNLSLIAYNIILNKLNYDEIETGDKLSDKNITAHKKLLSHIKPFNMYIRHNNVDTLIHKPEDIDSEMENNRNSTFVIKENIETLNSACKLLKITRDQLVEEISNL